MYFGISLLFFPFSHVAFRFLHALFISGDISTLSTLTSPYWTYSLSVHSFFQSVRFSFLLQDFTFLHSFVEVDLACPGHNTSHLYISPISIFFFWTKWNTTLSTSCVVPVYFFVSITLPICFCTRSILTSLFLVFIPVFTGWFAEKILFHWRAFLSAYSVIFAVLFSVRLMPIGPPIAPSHLFSFKLMLEAARYLLVYWFGKNEKYMYLKMSNIQTWFTKTFWFDRTSSKFHPYFGIFSFFHVSLSLFSPFSLHFPTMAVMLCLRVASVNAISLLPWVVLAWTFRFCGLFELFTYAYKFAVKTCRRSKEKFRKICSCCGFRTIGGDGMLGSLIDLT